MVDEVWERDFMPVAAGPTVKALTLETVAKSKETKRDAVVRVMVVDCSLFLIVEFRALLFDSVQRRLFGSACRFSVVGLHSFAHPPIASSSSSPSCLTATSSAKTPPKRTKDVKRGQVPLFCVRRGSVALLFAQDHHSQSFLSCCHPRQRIQ